MMVLGRKRSPSRGYWPTTKCRDIFRRRAVAERDAATVQEVRRLGHWIGNHTFHHPPLAALAWAGKDVVADVADTDRLIAELIGDRPFLLRPPYGNWSSRVAEALNHSSATRKYIGPVMWDIDGADHALGKPRNGGAWTLEKCAAKYLHEIESRQGGVVLLHDGGKPDDGMADSGGTLELLQRLVRQLKGRFEFKPLNEIPLAERSPSVTGLPLTPGPSPARGEGKDWGDCLIPASSCAAIAVAQKEPCTL